MDWYIQCYCVSAVKSLHFFSYYNKMTLDVIGETAFCLDLDAQYNPDEPFCNAAAEVFELGQPTKKP